MTIATAEDDCEQSEQYSVSFDCGAHNEARRRWGRSGVCGPAASQCSVLVRNWSMCGGLVGWGYLAPGHTSIANSVTVNVPMRNHWQMTLRPTEPIGLFT